MADLTGQVLLVYVNETSILKLIVIVQYYYIIQNSTSYVSAGVKLLTQARCVKHLAQLAN